MRTLAISLLLILAVPFVADSAFADPVEVIVPATGSGSAAADGPAPIATATSSTSTDWDLVEQYGPIWGGMLLAFGLASRLVRANADSHWISQGRALAFLVAVAGIIGAVLEAHFGGGTWAGVFVTAVAALKLVYSPTIKPKPAAPQYGAVDLLIVLIVLMAPLALFGCGPVGPGPAAEHAVIDCTGSNRPQIDALLVELSPLVTLQSPDWSAVYQKAKHAGAAVGGCVIAELVQDYLGGRRAVDNDESWTAHKTLEDFRHAEAGGASFKTRFGEL